MGTRKDIATTATKRRNGISLIELCDRHRGHQHRRRRLRRRAFRPPYRGAATAGAATRARRRRPLHSQRIARPQQPLRLSMLRPRTATCWIVIHSGSRCALQLRRPRPGALHRRRRTRSRPCSCPPVDRVALQPMWARCFRPAARHEHAGRHASPRRAGGRAIRHVVNVMGRVRTCSPAGVVAGQRPADPPQESPCMRTMPSTLSSRATVSRCAVSR